MFKFSGHTQEAWLEAEKKASQLKPGCMYRMAWVFDGRQEEREVAIRSTRFGMEYCFSNWVGTDGESWCPVDAAILNGSEFTLLEGQGDERVHSGSDFDSGVRDLCCFAVVVGCF